jgi:hypothetical protein
MTNTDDKVRDLLHEAGETHHIVFRLVDGVDDDWASWYSEWLIDHSELPETLGTRPVRSELTWLLVQLDKDYVERSPGEPWTPGMPRGSSRTSAPPDAVRQPSTSFCGAGRPARRLQGAYESRRRSSTLAGIAAPAANLVRTNPPRAS